MQHSLPLTYINATNCTSFTTFLLHVYSYVGLHKSCLSHNRNMLKEFSSLKTVTTYWCIRRILFPSSAAFPSCFHGLKTLLQRETFYCQVKLTLHRDWIKPKSSSELMLGEVHSSVWQHHYSFIIWRKEKLWVFLAKITLLSDKIW